MTWKNSSTGSSATRKKIGANRNFERKSLKNAKKTVKKPFIDSKFSTYIAGFSELLTENFYIYAASTSAPPLQKIMTMVPFLQYFTILGRVQSAFEPLETLSDSFSCILGTPNPQKSSGGRGPSELYISKILTEIFIQKILLTERKIFRLYVL